MIPLHFCSWLNKILHFHLLKFPHSENELAGNNLISKCLTDLCYTEREFLPGGFLYIQKIDENPLGRFRSEVKFAFLARNVSKLGMKHQVKLSHICPFPGSADGIRNFQLFN